MVKKTIAIICARGGSKRIPNKNIIDFFGKPLISWTIDAAINSNLFDKVIVSTESIQIAEIAKKAGAEIPFLRDNYFDDLSPVSSVICDTLEKIKFRCNEEYENVVHLMPNCPIRSSIDIANSYNNFLEKNINFQLSCFEFGWMNPWWAFKLNDENTIPLFPDALKKRSQDLEMLFCPTGAIWIAKTKNLLEEKTFYGKNFKLFPIPWKSAIDIDNYEDLVMAKAVFLLNERNKFEK